MAVEPHHFLDDPIGVFAFIGRRKILAPVKDRLRSIRIDQIAYVSEAVARRDGFKFSKSYYEYLYNNGRPAPFLQAREVRERRRLAG